MYQFDTCVTSSVIKFANTRIFAPQAQLEESATTEEKPEELLSRDLTRISDFALEHILRAFASGICVFGVRKGVLADLQIGQIFSVCLSVCTFFFAQDLDQVDGSLSAITRKISEKEGF